MPPFGESSGLLVMSATEACNGTTKAMPNLEGPVLSCYFPIGDPSVPPSLLDVYAAEGVDVLEMGFASSDPFLDGADVRASMARASRDNWRRDLDRVFDRLAGLRMPPRRLLMTYAEPDHPGLDDRSFWAGLDSVLVVGRPVEPIRPRIESEAKASGVRLSAFVGLPLADDAIASAQVADFYVMLQAVEGVTGPRANLDPAGAGRIAQLRQRGVRAPILLGFGISGGEQARQARALGADGAIVGSQVLRAALTGEASLARLLKELRSGLDV